MDVKTFKPICILKEAPAIFIIYISIAPSNELIINFSIFHIFILNINPSINIKKMQARIVNKLFVSKVIPPYL